MDWIDDDHEQPVDLRLWRKLLRYTLHYRRTTVLFLVVAVGFGAADLCFPIVTGRLISDIERNGGTVDLAPYAWVYVGLTVAPCASICGFVACAGKIRTHVSHDIRRDSFIQLQKLSFSFFDTRPVGWLMARLTSDCNRLSQILAWGVMDLVWATTLMIGTTIAMLIYDWRLAVSVLWVVPLLLAASIFFRKRILRTSRLVRRTNSKITGVYNESIVGVRTTKVFVRQSENLHDFDNLIGEMYGYAVRNSVLSAVYLPIVLALSSVAIASVLVTGGYHVIGNGLAVGDVVMFMYFAQLFFGPVQDLSAWFAELQMAQASAERILSLVEAVPEIQDSPEVVQQLAAGRNGQPRTIGRIEFQDVAFAYRDGPEVIHSLNLTVEPGQTIALVGETGGGKSTLISLLCRFYEPTRGHILIDGIDYRQRGLHWLQSSLGIVLQQPHLFSGTITENIRYGRLNATFDEIREASRVAGAHEFILSLEKGYDTQVGEGGNQLSLGQKQLVSFARAVLKQPQLMVMDEATSSIDTETERQIQKGLTRVLKGRTSFVIAHRLSTIRAADQIVLIEKGRIVEQGTHTDLMHQSGRYHDLYTEQSLRDIVRIDTELGTQAIG